MAQTGGSLTSAVVRPDGFAEFPAGGKLQLTLPPLMALNVGERVLIVGELKALDPGSGWGSRLSRVHVVATSAFPEVIHLNEPDDLPPWGTLINRWRLSLTQAIKACLPDPQAGLIAGLLVGAKDGLTDDLQQALVASGTSHLVVVSGYNITLVAAALSALGRGRKWIGTLVPLVGVWLFTLIAGANPPTLRAALMGTVALTTTRIGRGADPLGTLLVVAAGMLLLDPRLGLDLGFQLSALATVGLITLQPRVAALGSRLPGWVREPLAGTVAAQLATLPVLAASFHQISTVAPLSNVLAAPAIPVATIAAAIAAPLVAIGPAVAPFGTLLLFLPSNYLLAVIEGAARISGATLPAGTFPPEATAIYGLALLAWAGLGTPEGHDLRAWASAHPRVFGYVASVCVGLMVGAIIAGDLGRESPVLTVRLFDAGGGSAALLRTPGGQTVLIDGGASPAATTSEIGRHLGLNERVLSLALLTATDSSRLPGSTAAVERYPPRLAIAPASAQPSALERRWESAVADRLVRVREPTTLLVEPRLTIELFPTQPLELEANRPQPTLVMRLVYGESSLIYAPGANATSLQALYSEHGILASDVLIVPRGGAPDSLDAVSLQRIAPRAAVIPVATRNRGRPPSPQILNLLASVPTVRTDLSGAVQIQSDGQQVWIRPERF